MGFAGFFPLFLLVTVVILFSFIAVVVWSVSRRAEREAYYKSEMIKKIAELQGAGVNSAIEVMREQERNEARHRRDRLRLGGLITCAVGLGTMIFLMSNVPSSAFMVAIIPLLVGLVLLGYSFIDGSK